jgi:nuclear pore complex protein Nup188
MFLAAWLTRDRTYKVAFEWLCDLAPYKSKPWLIAFLSCESSIRVLTQAIHGFPAPSTQSKSSFETRTAAINVAPASHGHYNIQEIKEDALWLSKEVNLDEVEALRIVTIEWQNQPRDRLRQGLSETERASLHEVLGARSAAGPLSRYLSASLDHDPSKTFLSSESRRVRLLHIYLEERRSILGTCEKLICVALREDAVSVTTEGSPSRGSTSSDAVAPIPELGRLIFERATKVGTKNGMDNHVISCVEAMQSRLDNLERGYVWHKPEVEGLEIEINWVTTNMHELIVLSDLILLNLRTTRWIAKASLVLAWFQMLSKYAFFGNVQAQSEKQAHLISSLQLSAATTSLAILDPATSISYLLDSEARLQIEQDIDANSFYFFDRQNIGEIQEIFLKLAGACVPLASPAVFAWGVVLYTIRELGLVAKETREGQEVQKALDQGATNERRRLSSSSLGSTTTQISIYEDIVEYARNVSSGEDPVGYLTQSAIDGCHVFDIIANMASAPSSSTSPILACWRNMALLDLVRVSFDSIGYTPETLTAIMAIVDPDDQNINPGQMLQPVLKADLAAVFMSDETLMRNIFETAMARFPYEALPFIKLCKALSAAPRPNNDHPSIAERLLCLKSFTQLVPLGFSKYHTIREEENANLVSLEQPLELFATADSMLLGNSTEMIATQDIYHIPKGAMGQVISDSRPIVIMWYHEFSGLEFLGKWLELYETGEEAEFMFQMENGELVVSAIIQLLTALVNAANPEDACSILEEASNGLGRNSDIISVIFEIFEQDIQGLRTKRTADGSLSIVGACVEFMSAIANVLPGRIWPLLARSGFLNLDGAGSLLHAAVSIEATNGTFYFLDSSLKLYGKLLDDAITRAIHQGQNHTPREQRRLPPATDPGAPAHVRTRVLFAYTQVMTEMYDSLSSWQSKSTTFQAHVRIQMLRFFRNSLLYGFGVDDNGNPAAKLTSITSMAAPYVLDFFRPDSPNDTNLGTTLLVLANGLIDQDALHHEDRFQAQVEQTVQALWLCYDLIRAARLKYTVTFLERQLCQAFPVLIRLYGIHARYQLPCLKVMSELIALGSVSESDSASLLSFLGIESSRSLLEMLSTLDKPGSDTELYVTIWGFLTSLLSIRQQWLAIYLLTGSSPKEKLKEVKSDDPQQNTAIRGKAFFTMALDELSHIETLDGERAAAMLAFVCRAQENWSWATSSLQSHPDFFAGIMSHVGKLNVKQGSTLSQCHQYKIASLVAELSMVYLHYARSTQDYTIIKKMIPAFNWYATHAVAPTSYNTSLHTNLRKNFTSRYPQHSLLAYKHTAFTPPNPGPTFFYNTHLATLTLSSSPSWAGTPRHPGLSHDLQLANLNLSLVDAQLTLLQTFKALCIDHASFFTRDREVQKLMAQIIRNGLAANTQPCPATAGERIFDTICADRVELAVALLQGLVEVQARGSEFSTLLVGAWGCTRFRNLSYDAAVSNNDLPYYRACLTAVLLCVQLHSSAGKAAQLSLKPGQTSHAATRSTLLEVLADVVAQGLGQIASALYDQAQAQTQQRTGDVGAGAEASAEVGLRDFSLLLSILQSALGVPTLSQMVAQVSAVFVSSSIIDAALRLYSWSHRLLPLQADPVYASYALSFLVALSSLPPVAEELGIEGVLNRVATSRITLTLQRMLGGVGPLEVARGPNVYHHQQRLYVVWAEGILPLCLNLLHSVGRPMAGEIAAFLNQFPEQLARASGAFAFNAASRDPAAGAVSLSLAAEATTLALISHVLSSYRIAGASAGVDSFDIPILTRYDELESKKALKADVEELVSRKAFLRSRIVATSERELSWAKTKSKLTAKEQGGGEAENVLEGKIAAELRSALLCLKGGDSGEDEA